MVFLKKPFKYLRINKSFQFLGTFEALRLEMESLTDNYSEFTCNRLSINSFEILSIVSLGTLTVSGGSFNPIRVQAEITKLDEATSLVNISTYVRIEHYFFVLIFAVILMTEIYMKGPWSMSLITIGVFFIFHLWFHFIYRLQENSLIKKIVKQLGLIEN